MSSINKKAGFTLIELIIVIALLAVLASIAIPSYIGLTDRAAIVTDTANLRILNTSTQIYKVTENIQNEDVFSGINTDSERMNKLIDEGYLVELIDTQKENTTFYWYMDTQKWLYSLFDLAETPLSRYLFNILNVDDYIHTGKWDQNEDGFTSSYGLLFIDNNNDEYTISTTAQLGEGTSGGYGILFETSLIDEDNDSGYVLQFDRGYNAVIIRPRNNGDEESPVLILKNSNCSLIPDSRDNDWWTQEHEIALQVNNSDTENGNKELSVYIDNETILSDWSFESNTESENNYTGFRSWGAETTYKEMDIE